MLVEKHIHPYCTIPIGVECKGGYCFSTNIRTLTGSRLAAYHQYKLDRRFLTPLRCVRNDDLPRREKERGIGGSAADSPFPSSFKTPVIPIGNFIPK